MLKIPVANFLLIQYFSLFSGVFWLIVATGVIDFDAHSPTSFFWNPFATYAALTAAFIYCLVLRRDPAALCIGLAAIAVLLYFYIIRFHAHPYDWEGHRATIHYYMYNSIPPPSLLCWECHQPPLYYFLAGKLAYIASQFTHVLSRSVDCARALNFFFFAMYLLYAAKIVLCIIRPRYLALLGIATIMFWPFNLLHCARITNDILISLSVMGATYHYMRCYRRYDRVQAQYCILWLAVAFATKSSSIVLFTALAINFLWHNRCILRHIPLVSRAKELRVALLILLIGIGLGYGRNYYNYLHEENGSLLYGRDVDPAGTNLNHNMHFYPSQFYTFDYTSFIHDPYIILGSRLGHIELFWNFFLRTVSYGEFYWAGGDRPIIMNQTLLVLIGFTVLALSHRVFILRRGIGWAGFLYVYIVLGLIGLGCCKVFFYGHPWVDARHFMAIIPFFVISYAYLLSLYRRTHPRLYALALTPLLIYFICSLWHYCGQVPVSKPAPASISKPAKQ